MSSRIVKVFSILAAVLFISLTVLELNAEARAGGSRSSGSRGSKSYSRPAPAYQQPAQARPQPATPPTTYQQQGGGFMRSMAGGLMGGMIGSMLFGGSANAGNGTPGSTGGGIGFLEIIMLAGGGYLLYRFIQKRKNGSA